MNYFEKRYNRIDITPEHYFDVTLADFEQIINIDCICNLQLNY